MKIYMTFISLYSLLFTTSAWAYLDPGTGSMVVSFVIGAIATLAYVGRGWFYGLKNKNKKKK